MYDELVKRLRAAAIMSEALSIFLPHSEGSATAKLYNEAADAIEELIAALTASNTVIANSKPHWISVEERLPEHGQEVLCACKAGIYEVFKYVDGISGPWYKDSRHVYMKGFVTHWMPLPEPPKEE